MVSLRGGPSVGLGEVGGVEGCGTSSTPLFTGASDVPHTHVCYRRGSALIVFRLYLLPYIYLGRLSMVQKSNLLCTDCENSFCRFLR